MKKIALWLVVVLLALGFSACGSDDNNLTIEEISHKFIEDIFINKEYDNVYEGYSFSDEMKAAISSEFLKTVSEQSEERHGQFDKISSTQTQQSGTTSSVVMLCAAKNSGFQVTLSFDTDKKIIGLFFAPTIDLTPLENGERVSIGAEGRKLPGVLTTGRDSDNLVILLPGSGANDINGTIGQITPYRDLAEQIASEGTAVYRFYKRTYYYAGTNKINVNTLTPYEEIIEDAISAVNYFSDPTSPHYYKNIILTGHSLGGYLLPKIYEMVQNKDAIKKLVYLAANVSPLEDLLVDQHELYVQDHNLSASTYWQQVIAQYEELREVVKNLTPQSPYTPAQLGGCSKYYYLYLKDYNPVEIAETIDIPMLFVFGEKDKNVPLKEEEFWKNGLADKENVEFKTFAGLTHLFINGTGWAANDVNQKQSVSLSVTKFVHEWIVQ